MRVPGVMTTVALCDKCRQETTIDTVGDTHWIPNPEAVPETTIEATDGNQWDMPWPAPYVACGQIRRYWRFVKRDLEVKK